MLSNFRQVSDRLKIEVHNFQQLSDFLGELVHNFEQASDVIDKRNSLAGKSSSSLDDAIARARAAA